MTTDTRQREIESAPDKGVSRSEQAYRIIKDRILNNVYPPEFRALESEMAQELGVSRTPMREALVRLEQDGLIEVIPRHGFRVTPIALGDMVEIYDVLTALESMAVELIARRKLSEPELAPLRKTVEDMENSLAKGDVQGWARADQQFHAVLMTMCGNSRLGALLQAVRDQSQRVRMATLPLRDTPDRSTSDHRELYDAIAQGAAAKAHRLHKAHLQEVARELSEIVAARPNQRL